MKAGRETPVKGQVADGGAGTDAEASAEPAGRAAEGMAGLAKGLAVIEALGVDRPRLTITDAAQATGLTRATARRCLLTLESLGYLTHDGRYFHPTPRMLRLGGAYRDAAPLPRLAEPHLVAAREELGESVSLAVLTDDEAMFVARAEAQHIVMTGVRVGAGLPAYGSATGRVLLSALPEDELTAYLDRCHPVARTAHTHVDPAHIRRLVARAGAEGYALTDEELALGMRSLAVRVADSRGRPVAAMSVSAATARVSLDELCERFLPVLRERAERLGRTL